MTDTASYAVFIHPGALEALSDSIKPYLSEGPQGVYLACREVDSSGGFFEVALDTRADTGETVAVELMIPASMIRLVVSMHSDRGFGFRGTTRVRSISVGSPVSAPVIEESTAPADHATDTRPK